MAKLSFEGMDDVIRQMERMGQMGGKVADDMLQAGGAEMKKAWKNAITRHGHVRTGEMRRKVGYAKKSTKRASGRSLDVYPLGKDKKNVRNAEKAFVLHYGKSTKAGTHFVDAAEAEGQPKAEAAMESMWNRFLEKGN